MKSKEAKAVEEIAKEEELEVQTTFNEDGLEILVEDGGVENAD